MIDLNVDIGEGFPWDAELIGIATSANVCLGAHGGSRALALETIAACRPAGVRVGLHPGFPDRANFGRAKWHESRMDEARSSILEQVEGLGASYLKPHGAFYNQSASEPAWAEMLAQVLRTTKLPLMGLNSSLHCDAAESAGVTLIREGFADRRFDEHGRLLPREHPAAFVSAEDQIQHVATQLGLVDSICVHGDVEGCVDRLRQLRDALAEVTR